MNIARPPNPDSHATREHLTDTPSSWQRSCCLRHADAARSASFDLMDALTPAQTSQNARTEGPHGRCWSSFFIAAPEKQTSELEKGKLHLPNLVHNRAHEVSDDLHNESSMLVRQHRTMRAHFHTNLCTKFFNVLIKL